MSQETHNPYTDANILLVEDNPGDVILMQEAFNSVSFNYTLHNVIDGEQALDFLHKRGDHTDAVTPQLVLLDLNLPKHSGYTILESIKNDDALQHIPVLVISSSRAPNDISRSYDLGANSYISKPQTLDGIIKLAEAIKSFWFECALIPTQK